MKPEIHLPIAIDEKVPDFTAASTGGEFRLSEHLGKTLVLYFYPKDNTPGCTVEGQDFGAHHRDFIKAGAEVFGISRDSLKSHQNFKEKMQFPFELLSDPDEALCSLFDVMKMKNMYGKKVRGVERSTYVIDSKGVLRKEWRGVKVPSHVEQVLEYAKSLAKQ